MDSIKNKNAAGQATNGINIEQDKDNSKFAFYQLKELYFANQRKRYPNFPDDARTSPKYTDKNTKGLTNCVMDYIKFNGYHVERTGCEGRIIDDRKTFTDVIGRVRTIGTIRRVYSSSQRGTSDLKAIINGKFIAIEIKCFATNDRQSAHQKAYQKQIEQSNGIYIIVKTFAQFYDWFNKFVEA